MTVRLRVTCRILTCIIFGGKWTPALILLSTNPWFPCFLLFPFTNFHVHRTAGEAVCYLFNSSLLLSPFHRQLDTSWAITARSSFLHVASRQIRNRNFCFSEPSRYPLTTKLRALVECWCFDRLSKRKIKTT